MSYADSVITRYEATVDDEYQRMLLHQSSTIGFTAMMWLCYLLAVVLIWAMPGQNMETVAVAIFLVPLLALLIGQSWLRKKVPLPRINRVSKGEMAALGVILLLWVGGIARSRTMIGTELAGYLTGAVVGAGIGIAIVLLIFKVVYPAVRDRDQRRLDRELDDDID